MRNGRTSALAKPHFGAGEAPSGGGAFEPAGGLTETEAVVQIREVDVWLWMMKGLRAALRLGRSLPSSPDEAARLLGDILARQEEEPLERPPASARRAAGDSPMLPPKSRALAAPVVGEMAPRCPEDASELEVRGDAHACPSCGGLFVPSPAAARIDEEPERFSGLDTSAAPAEAAGRPATGYRRCPVCSTMMSRFNYGKVSGVLVDRCPAHGVWFDQGELTAVLSFLKGGGEAKTAAFEAKEALFQPRQAEKVAELSARFPSGRYSLRRWLNPDDD